MFKSMTVPTRTVPRQDIHTITSHWLHNWFNGTQQLSSHINAVLNWPPTVTWSDERVFK